MFCQNRKVEPKGGLQVFQMLEALQEFWLWSKEKMNKKWFYYMRGRKNIFKKWPSKNSSTFVIPTVQNFCQVPKKKKWVILKNAAIQKHCREYFKNDSWDWKLEACSWKRHTMCWNWAAWGKKPKRCFHKASRSCKNVQSKTGLKVSNGDSLIRSRQRGRKEEGLVD